MGVGGEIGQVLFRLRIDQFPGSFKQRLIEAAIAQFPCKVTDGRKDSASQGNEAVKQSPEGFLRPQPQGFDVCQAPFEDAQDEGNLLFGALVGFVNPEQALFQFRRALQTLNTVMSQGATESSHERRGESFTARVEHPQVRKQVSLGGRPFPRSGVFHLQLAMEKRGDVHKDLDNLIFALCDPVAIASLLTREAPCGEQARDTRRIHIKTQSELAKLAQVVKAKRMDVVAAFRGSK